MYINVVFLTCKSPRLASLALCAPPSADGPAMGRVIENTGKVRNDVAWLGGGRGNAWQVTGQGMEKAGWPVTDCILNHQRNPNTDKKKTSSNRSRNNKNNNPTTQRQASLPPPPKPPLQIQTAVSTATARIWKGPLDLVKTTKTITQRSNDKHH